MNQVHLHTESSTLRPRSSFPDNGPFPSSRKEPVHMLAVTLSRTAGYLDALEKLAPLVEEHRTSFDRERRLPETIFRTLAEAGLFRLWLPAAMGGPELSPLEFMRVVEAASAKDGSIGWVVAKGGGLEPGAR